ncbi:MAG: nucleotidyltransferase family protein [Candidatus Lokiarchaeota archaeon]|nr:nucleotidyltransferase family protein [Candidatus Lokiarchaeota archaeon]
MKPYTNRYQKTMIPVHDKPLLEYIINGLILAGFKELIIVVGYLKEQVINYFQNGDKWGINIEYVEQTEINGTGGALLLCEDMIKDSHLFLTWGDVLVSYNVYKEVDVIFKKENQDYVLVTNYTDDPYKGGAVDCEGKYCIEVKEKPTKGKSGSNLNNCGIFVFSKKVFDVLKELKPSKRGEIELTEAINYGITKQNWKVRVIKMAKDQFRGDFGDIKVYEQLNKDTDWLRKL